MNRKRLVKLTRNQRRWMEWMDEYFSRPANGGARPAIVIRKQMLDCHAAVIAERGNDKGLKYPCWITESAYLTPSRGEYAPPWDLLDAARAKDVADGVDPVENDRVAAAVA